MIPLLVGAGLGLAGNIAGLIGSSEENRKRQALINQRRMNVQNMFDKEYNQDFLANSENTSAIKNISNKLKEKQLAQDNTGAIMGTSDESSVAQKGENGRTYADFVNNLAAKATDSKARIRSEYINQMNGVDQAEQALNTDKGNNWVNFGKMAGQVGGAVMQAGSMGTEGAAGAATKLKTPAFDLSKASANNYSFGQVPV